jgi:aryl-alcohol dehydrogenase-like predicted oxidoreductase
MELRHVDRLGRDLSVIGQGCWQFGGDWGEVTDGAALGVLAAAADSGVTFIDTADVYGDGRSEQIVGRFLADRGGADAAGLFVATKTGRRAQPHVAEAYTYANFKAWTDRSRRLLGVDTLQLVQLHCPPTPVFGSDRVYADLDRLVEEGSIAAYGVSVETVAEALAAIAHPGVKTVQIILNVFRQKPVEEALPAAAAAGVGIIARVPLASGLLSGHYDLDMPFPASDLRATNKNIGGVSGPGEVFAGLPYDVGVVAAREVAAVAAARGDGTTTAQLALRWVIDQPGVTTVIPGASKPAQATANAAAAGVTPLTADERVQLQDIYDRYARPHVHHLW